MRKKYYTKLPERQRERMLSYVPAVTKVINKFDPIGVFPGARGNHYESEIYAIAFHMTLLGKEIHFLDLSKIIYVEFAHSFSITEISEKDCLAPAAEIVKELGVSGP